jgi:hypothetical protein
LSSRPKLSSTTISWLRMVLSYCRCSSSVNYIRYQYHTVPIPHIHLIMSTTVPQKSRTSKF